MKNIESLITEYIKKYEREPNAILINEKNLNRLQVSLSPYAFKENLCLSDSKIYVYQYQGLTVIPIRYGKTQVVEILEGETYERNLF